MIASVSVSLRKIFWEKKSDLCRRRLQPFIARYFLQTSLKTKERSAWDLKLLHNDFFVIRVPERMLSVETNASKYTLFYFLYFTARGCLKILRRATERGKATPLTKQIYPLDRANPILQLFCLDIFLKMLRKKNLPIFIWFLSEEDFLMIFYKKNPKSYSIRIFRNLRTNGRWIRIEGMLKHNVFVLTYIKKCLDIKL